MGWLETLLKSFTEHAVFNVHLCLWNFNCIVFSSEKINYWGIEKTFVRKEGKVLDSSYCFVLFTNHCICFNILLVTAQDFKCEKKNLLLSLSLDLHNVGYIFLFSWVPGHNLWFHIVKFIFTTNHLPSSGERSQQNPCPNNLSYVSDAHQPPQASVCKWIP